MSKVETTKKEKKQRTPALAYTHGKDKGKRCSGLHWPFTAAEKKALQGFNLANTFSLVHGRAKYKVARGQFAKPHYYYLYMAAKAQAEAQGYKEVAADAERNPDKYTQERVPTKEKIAAALAEQEAKILQTTLLGCAKLVQSGVAADFAAAYALCNPLASAEETQEFCNAYAKPFAKAQALLKAQAAKDAAEKENGAE